MIHIRVLIVAIFLFTSAAPITAQTKEAQLIDEFGNLPCDDLISRSSMFGHVLKEDPHATAYVVFYEGKHAVSLYDMKTNSTSLQLLDPRVNEGRHKASAVILDLTKWRKFPKKRFVLIDGGFRENFTVQLWIVRRGGDIPKLAPTLDRKDIRIGKGRSKGIPDCEANYSE